MACDAQWFAIFRSLAAIVEHGVPAVWRPTLRVPATNTSL